MRTQASVSVDAQVKIHTKITFHFDKKNGIGYEMAIYLEKKTQWVER